QRDEIGGILDVASNRNRPRDIAVNETERTTEQVDAGGNQRGANPVVVEDQRLDQIVGVTAMIGRVDDPVAARGVDDVMEIFVLAFDLAQNRVQRMLKRAIQ